MQILWFSSCSLLLPSNIDFSYILWQNQSLSEIFCFNIDSRISSDDMPPSNSMAGAERVEKKKSYITLEYSPIRMPIYRSSLSISGVQIPRLVDLFFNALT